MKRQPAIQWLLLISGLLSMAMMQAGCGPAKNVAGIGAFKVSVANDKLDASLQLTKYQTHTQVSLPIPYLENSQISIGPVMGGKGALIELTVPIASILNAVSSTLPVEGLPDGRPLYGTTPGKLPATDFILDALKVRLYLSGEIFGLFIPIPLPKFGDPIQFPIKDQRGYVVAYAIAVAPSRAGSGSGLIVLFPIQALVE